jgi:hypothetical protein
VVVVPLAMIGSVVAGLAEVREKEAAMDAAVRGGAKQPAWLAERLSRADVRYVDGAR